MGRIPAAGLWSPGTRRRRWRYLRRTRTHARHAPFLHVKPHSRLRHNAELPLHHLRISRCGLEKFKTREGVVKRLGNGPVHFAYGFRFNGLRTGRVDSLGQPLTAGAGGVALAPGPYGLAILISAHV